MKSIHARRHDRTWTLGRRHERISSADRVLPRTRAPADPSAPRPGIRYAPPTDGAKCGTARRGRHTDPVSAQRQNSALMTDRLSRDIMDSRDITGQAIVRYLTSATIFHVFTSSQPTHAAVACRLTVPCSAAWKVALEPPFGAVAPEDRASTSALLDTTSLQLQFTPFDLTRDSAPDRVPTACGSHVCVARARRLRPRRSRTRRKRWRCS